MLYSLWHHGARCNVASPRHYFGRTEVFLSKASRVGLQRWQLSLQWILLFDCCCLRKSSFSSQFYFIFQFSRERGRFSTLFCVNICISYLCMNLWKYKIRIYLIIHFPLSWQFTKPVATPVKVSVPTVVLGANLPLEPTTETILNFRYWKTKAGFSFLTGDFRFCLSKMKILLAVAS